MHNRKHRLYAVTEHGVVTFVGDRLAAEAAAMVGGHRRVQLLTEHEADVYVQEGCPGLTRLFASVGRVPR